MNTLEAIKRVKSDKGITDRELAGRLGVAVSTINRTLNGKTPYPILFRIANELEVEIVKEPSVFIDGYLRLRLLEALETEDQSKGAAILRELGFTFEQIGRFYGLTRQRIHQIASQ